MSSRSADLDKKKPLGQVKDRAETLVAKAGPFAAQAAASGAAFCFGLGVCQVAGFIARVSCATPVIGPVLGAVSVGLSSAFAGQVSRHVKYLIATKQNPLKTPILFTCDIDEILVDAALGMVFFKVLNGRFSSVMPSNLSKPGALAFESFPGRGDSYASPGARKELMRVFKRDGCHHCGKRWGEVIGDHMPPVKQLQKAAQSGSLTEAIATKLMQKLLNGAAVDTRLFPQCRSCSSIQSVALRRDVRKLVLHRVYHNHNALAGVLVGLRHFTSDAGAASARSSAALTTKSLTWLPWLQLAHAADEFMGAQVGEDGDTHVDDFVVTGVSVTEDIPHSSYSPQGSKHVGFK